MDATEATTRIVEAIFAGVDNTPFGRGSIEALGKDAVEIYGTIHAAVVAATKASATAAGPPRTNR